ncbi:hypothetical protein NYE69_28140 [Paenibacillus sp. FSL R5-0527]|uniref:hypothetical protein n=1 Tax=Paenibacillus sp. FSL R5-0527 TaxID=2975321 RepID=UPI0026A4A0A6
MAKIPDRIDNDEEFNELCSRMVKCAELIEDPLSTPREVAAYKSAYDRMWKVAEEYRLRDRGVSFYPGAVTPPPETALAAAKQPASKQEAAPPDEPDTGKKVDIGAWLDDD